jgi:hypothetical protein
MSQVEAEQRRASRQNRRRFEIREQLQDTKLQT